MPALATRRARRAYQPELVINFTRPNEASSWMGRVFSKTEGSEQLAQEVEAPRLHGKDLRFPTAAIQGLTKGWLISDSDLPDLSAWVDLLSEEGDRDAANPGDHVPRLRLGRSLLESG